MNFGTVTQIDPLIPTGPNEILFAGQTRLRPNNHVLVAGAHWRHLVSTNGSSAVPAKRQQPIYRFDSAYIMQQRLSLYARLMHSSVLSH